MFIGDADCSGADYRLENDGACYRQGVSRPQLETVFPGLWYHAVQRPPFFARTAKTIMPYAFVHRARNATVCTALVQEKPGEKPLV